MKARDNVLRQKPKFLGPIQSTGTKESFPNRPERLLKRQIACFHGYVGWAQSHAWMDVWIVAGVENNAASISRVY